MPFSENVTVDEGVNAYGIRTQFHFQGDQLITQRTFDAEPLLRACAEERAATAGQGWGEMRKIGSVPMAIYAKFLTIRDAAERQKYIKAWLKANPAFCTFDRALVIPQTYRVRAKPSDIEVDAREVAQPQEQAAAPLLGAPA